MRNGFALLVVALAGGWLAGCNKGDSSSSSPPGSPTTVPAAAAAAGGPVAVAGPVVLYTSVDDPYVRPIVAKFTERTGIAVTLVTDAEASKSAGLAEKILAEKGAPKADVFWNNEVFRTVQLADAGALAAYDSPAAADLPAKFKDGQHRWAGSALRVRVLVANPKHVKQPLTELGDLLKPGLKGHVAMARPTGGTTGGHVAALTVVLGKAKADAFFAGLHKNGVTLVGGNSVVADSVARGDAWAGVCDNDDAAASQANVGPLTVSLPGQQDGGLGTLAMPCAVALIAGGPHPDAGRKLVDYVLSAETDKALVDAKFAWCSARDVKGHGKFMQVDYAKAAAAMPAAVTTATAVMEGR